MAHDEIFVSLLKLSQRIVADQLGKSLWNSGYADLTPHADVLEKIVQKYADEAGPLFKAISSTTFDFANLLRENSDNWEQTLRSLLALIVACIQVPARPTASSVALALNACSAYFSMLKQRQIASAQLSPSKTALGGGSPRKLGRSTMHLFHGHIYLACLDTLTNAAAQQGRAQSICSAMRLIPVRESCMDEDPIVVRATTDLLALMIRSDAANVLEFEDLDYQANTQGQIAMQLLVQLIDRRPRRETFANVFTSLFPLLLCVEQKATTSVLPNTIPQLQARLSDQMACFLVKMKRAHGVVPWADNSEEDPFPVGSAIEQLIDRSPDKAEYRDRCVSLAMILANGGVTDQGLRNLVSWAVAFGQSNRVGARVIAVDLLARLSRSGLCPCRCSNDAAIRHLIKQSGDGSSHVRSRALNLLTEMLDTDNETAAAPSSSRFSVFTMAHDGALPAADDHLCRSSTSGTDPIEILVLSKALALVEDNGALVRGAAVRLLEATILRFCNNKSKKNSEQEITEQQAKLVRLGIETVAQRCCDVSPLVRSRAVTALAKLFSELDRGNKTDRLFQIAEIVGINDTEKWIGGIWLTSTLPLVADAEQRAQEKGVQQVANMLLPSSGSLHCWGLLELLATSNCRAHMKHLRSGLTLALKSGWINATRLLESLRLATDTVVGNPKSPGAWLLIGEISAAASTLNSAADAKRFKTALRNLEQRVNPAALWSSLVAESTSFSHHAISLMESILGVISVCSTVSKDEASATGNMEKFAEDLTSRISTLNLPQGILRTAIGVASIVAPESIKPIAAKLAKRFLNSEHFDSDSISIRCEMQSLGFLAQVVPHNAAIPEMDRVLDRIGSIVTESTTPRLLLAQAVQTLGQLCLRNRSAAMKFAPALRRLLQAPQGDVDVLVRMMSLNTLADWSVFHTSVAEPYVPCMAQCLDDPEPVLRRHSLAMISRLLDGNFVRWQDELFFRLVTAVVDVDPAIATAARRYFDAVVVPREKNLFLRKFLDSVFFFTGYKKTTYSKASSSANTRLSALVNSRDQRFGIYRYMLDVIASDEERLGLLRRLLDGVVLAVVRGEIDVAQQAGENVLLDSCQLLQLPQLKFVGLLRENAGAGGIDEEEAEAAAMVGEIATGTSQGAQSTAAAAEAAHAKAQSRADVRRNVLRGTALLIVTQELLPTCVSLRNYSIRVTKKSSLVNAISDLLVAIITDYEQELQDVLQADPELEREVQFHARQAKQMQKDRQQLQQQVHQLSANVVPQQQQQEQSSEDGATSEEVPPPVRPPSAATRRSQRGGSRRQTYAASSDGNASQKSSSNDAPVEVKEEPVEAEEEDPKPDNDDEDEEDAATERKRRRGRGPRKSPPARSKKTSSRSPTPPSSAAGRRGGRRRAEQADASSSSINAAGNDEENGVEDEEVAPMSPAHPKKKEPRLGRTRETTSSTAKTTLRSRKPFRGEVNGSA